MVTVDHDSTDAVTGTGTGTPLTRDAWLRPHYHAGLFPRDNASAHYSLAWAIVHQGDFRWRSQGSGPGEGMEVAGNMGREAAELGFNDSFLGLWARGMSTDANQNFSEWVPHCPDQVRSWPVYPLVVDSVNPRYGVIPVSATVECACRHIDTVTVDIRHDLPPDVNTPTAAYSVISGTTWAGWPVSGLGLDVGLFPRLSQPHAPSRARGMPCACSRPW